jgi:L-lactate utilization protein LutB
MGMTITEALAEIKTIGKRLEKKRQAIYANLGRDMRLVDPLEGGSVEFIKRERQAIEDLEKRIVAIRTAIQKSNLETRTTVGEMTHTIAEWLTFRREVATGRQQFLASINNGVKNIRDKIQREGGRVTSVGMAATAIVDTNKNVADVSIHVNERELLAEQERLEQTLGELDGKLSLLNATTVIPV